MRTIASRLYLAILLIRIRFALRWNLQVGHWFDLLR